MGNQNNTSLKTLYSALQTEMIAKANFSSVLSHPTDKGDNTEESWISWFNEYFPKRYKAAKATVIDSNGALSNQIDVVLYDAQYSYLAFNNNGILYVPAESVYAVFEVKIFLKSIWNTQDEMQRASELCIEHLHRFHMLTAYINRKRYTGLLQVF